MKQYFLLLALVLVIGCTHRMLTDSEKLRAAEVYAYAPAFTVPADQSAQAWARAQDWISRYSTMKVQSSSDSLIQTYSPWELYQFGYTVSRIPQGETFNFRVQCNSVPWNVEVCAVNEKALVEFVVTGQGGSPLD